MSIESTIASIQRFYETDLKETENMIAQHEEATGFCEDLDKGAYV